MIAKFSKILAKQKQIWYINIVVYVLLFYMEKGEEPVEFQTVFGPDPRGPAPYYRIPSMITTKNGVVVACADARVCSGMDNPNRIDKVVRRSTDSGKTWGEYIVAVAEHGTKQMRASAAIDPVMAYLPESGRILLLYSHTPARVGIRNSCLSVGETPDGARFVRGRARRYLWRGDRLVTESGKETPYTVTPDGDIFKDGKKRGNLYTGGAFKEESTSYLMLCYSDDDGLTWSKPVSLNRQVKLPYMSFIGPGPGRGVVLEHGAHKGRVVFPIYFGTRKFPLRLSCTVIYSDDGGKTWRLGESPNNTREIDGARADCRTVKSKDMLTESQLIEQEDGTLKLFMRNHDPRHSTAVAYSKNGGESWENFTWDDALPQPVCQMSVLKLQGTEKPTVVFLNPADRRDRAEGTVRLSEDDGETFPYSRLLKPGPFVYSCMTQLPDGNIGALFEPDTKCREIRFASFSVDWIKEG